MKTFSNEETLARLDYIQSSIECGVHSGFPACCIRFFVTEKIWMSNESNLLYSNKIYDRSKELGKAWDYIPCLNCLEYGVIFPSKPCPTGSRCSPQDGREMVNIIKIDMIDKINNVQSGFQIIKDGKVSVAGSLSMHVSHSIESLSRLINL